MKTKSITIKINYQNDKQNIISLPFRMGSITTKGFIYADSMKQIYKMANKFASEIASRLTEIKTTEAVVQCLEVGVMAFMLKQWGYIETMEMSKEFVVFYNIAVCAFLPESEHTTQQITFDCDREEEFITAR